MRVYDWIILHFISSRVLVIDDRNSDLIDSLTWSQDSKETQRVLGKKVEQAQTLAIAIHKQAKRLSANL